MKEITDSQLRQLQLTQLEILKQIDKVCRRHHIAYSLYAGTLLGAVRHNGFIPWDDDLDICMSRNDYQRFLQIWENEQPAGYILQNKDKSANFYQSFSKIRKDHTCFIEFETEPGRYHTGIFVDVFPIDRMPAGKLKRKLFQFQCLEYQLLNREYIPPKGSIAQKALSTVLLGIIPKKKRPNKRERLLEKITRHNRYDSLPCVAIEIKSTIQTPLPSNFMLEFIELPFEGCNFMCSALWKEYLSAKYGDYMKLPPESERVWKHHPIILNFNCNYEELSDEEKPPLRVK